MFGKFRSRFPNAHHIVAFPVNKYAVKTQIGQDINQFLTTIPRIKSDRVFPEIHTLRSKEIKHLFDHRHKTGGFICVASTLFTDKRHIERNDQLTNLDRNAQHILTPHSVIMFFRPPLEAIGQRRTISWIIGIIHTYCGTLTRLCRSTF